VGATQSSSSARILIIDDNPAIHQDFHKIFQDQDPASRELEVSAAALFDSPSQARATLNYQLDSAFQGQEGLALAGKALAEGRPYSLAFVDVRMPPGWDGIETIRQIWQICPQMQMVICTAYSDYSWAEIVSHIGARDNLVILKKPFDNIEVQQLANTLTQKWLLSLQAKTHLEDLDRIVHQRTLELSQTNQSLHKEIEERKLIERALRLSEQRFSKAFKASPIPMAIQSLPRCLFVDANDSFAKLLNLSREEILGHTGQDLFLDSTLETTLQDLLRANSQVRQRPAKLALRAGRERSVLVSMELLDLGDQPHLLLITEDVTERLALEHELRQAQKVEAIGQLAAGVAHDFNNILTVIQGHVGLCGLAPAPAPQISDSLKQIDAAAERAAALTRQLLTFSHKQTIQRQVLDINTVLRNLRKMLGRLIGEHISLEWSLQNDLPNVFADTGCVEQVLMNLVVNARDAMPDGGQISISTRRAHFEPDACHQHNPESEPGDYVAISVRDSGSGMSPDVLSRIFEPFFTTKGIGKGTGLGLATVHSILKQHGGWIDVTSAPGKGSVFELYLPATIRAASSKAPGSSSEELLDGRERILLVEDEAPLREMTARILRQHGYSVHEACSGKAALEIWEQQQGELDLVLTDVVMPEALSGVALAENLLARKRGLHIIYMSGYSMDFAGRDLSRDKGLFFLQKPFTPLQLLRIIRASLDKQDTPAATV
jgi:two-component system, cell cycle sensor histidine kinase and response regulator CckA